MKKEIIWWVALAALSTLIIGVSTNFRFGRLDVSFHDTYYVFDSLFSIKALTLLFGFCRYLYFLIDIIAERYKIFALFIAILNAIFAVFVTIAAYVSVESFISYSEKYPNINLPGNVLMASTLFGILIIQAIVEVKILGKLNALWKK